MKKLVFISTICLILGLSTAFVDGPDQLITTKLKVTVLDDTGNLIEDAAVKLYKTKEDYDKLKNPVREGKTNDKGYIFFKSLDPIEYYMNVEKGSANNFGGAEKTEKLQEKRINKVNVIISSGL